MANQSKRHIFPIRVKTILMITIFGLILAEIAMIYFSVVSSNTNKANYKKTATNLAYTVALSIDVPKVKNITDQVVSYYEASETKPGRDQEGTPEYEAYMAQFDTVRQSQDYKDLQKYLLSVRNANTDTDGIYLGYVDTVLKNCVYVLYDEENEVFPVGIIDPLYEEDYPMLEDPMLGFVASIYVDEATGTTLVTAGAPVVGDDNKVICYALVDISMDTVRASQASRIVRLFIYLVSTVLLLCVVGVLVINSILIKPVRTLRKVAMSYDVNDPEKTHEIFSNLHVHVHDEFADLADAMKVMESDVHDKIHELTDAYASLLESQAYAGHMEELANTDALTGVANKIAFDHETAILNEAIGKGEAVEFGLAMIDLNFLKTINDEYGHDSGDRALMKLCNIIGAIFGSAPVYRVGGDEFIILFKGKDYKDSEKLVQEFVDRIDELRLDKSLLPEEQVSAAIGYAGFDPSTDHCVDDVFKRADAAMYAHKRKMKGE